jgi:hypothetical protein
MNRELIDLTICLELEQIYQLSMLQSMAMTALQEAEHLTFSSKTDD